MSEEGNPNNSQTGLILAIVFAAMVIGGSLLFFALQSSGTTVVNDLSRDQLAALLDEIDNQVDAPYAEIVDDDPVLGNPNAPVTLVEFSDYNCFYCQRNFSETMPQVKRDYIDTGKLKYVFRDMPFRGMPAAHAANCAREQGGDEVYFQINKLLFGKAGQATDDDFLAFAKDLNLDVSQFGECVSSEKYASEIANDLNTGIGYGIEGTPGFVITDGKKAKLIRGALPYELPGKPTDFKREIEAFFK